MIGPFFSLFSDQSGSNFYFVIFFFNWPLISFVYRIGTFTLREKRGLIYIYPLGENITSPISTEELACRHNVVMVSNYQRLLFPSNTRVIARKNRSVNSTLLRSPSKSSRGNPSKSTPQKSGTTIGTVANTNIVLKS